MPIGARPGGIKKTTPHGVRDAGSPSGGTAKPYDEHKVPEPFKVGGRSNDARKPK